MKSVKELTENLEAKKQEARDFVKGLEGETLTDEQRASIDSLTDEVEALKGDLERAKKLEEVTKVEAKKAAAAAGGASDSGESKELDKLAERFTFGDAVRAAMGVHKDAGVLREVNQLGEQEMSKCSIDTRSNSIVIPTQILNRMNANVEKRANVTENTTTGVDTTNFVQSVYADTICSKLGCTFIDSVQDVRVPIIGAATTKFEGESDASADGGSATTKKDLTPTRIATYINYTKQAALQSNFSLDAALRDAISQSLAAKVEYAIFTDDSSEGGWTYIGDSKSQAGGSSTTATLMAHAVMEEVLGNNHMRGNLGFAISHQLYSEVYSAVLATGVSALVQDGMIHGLPFYFSTQIADIASDKESMYFGDWSKAWIAQFGGVEILTDPYTQAASGMDRLVLNTFWDFSLIQANAISVDGYDG